MSWALKRSPSSLNCYANDAYAGGTKVLRRSEKSLVDNNMIYGDGSSKAGMMNPSYPLNYMEKPLTRLMLGRSRWDLNIKVDVEKYPEQYRKRTERY